jgi:hypothetical protein
MKFSSPLAGLEDDDTLMAYVLLNGRQGELQERIYPKGRDELRARKALARVLLAKKPPDPLLIFLLAALFDPDINLELPDTQQLRERRLRSIKFQYLSRKDNRRPPPGRDGMVASWIRDRIDNGLAVNTKDAKRLAMKEFSLSEETVRRIWREDLRLRRRLQEQQSLTKLSPEQMLSDIDGGSWLLLQKDYEIWLHAKEAEGGNS